MTAARIVKYIPFSAEVSLWSLSLDPPATGSTKEAVLVVSCHVRLSPRLESELEGFPT